VTTLLKLLKSTTFRLLLLFAMLFASAAILVIVYISWNSNRLLEERLKETILAETLGLAEQYRSGGVTKLAKVINRRIITPSNSIYLVTDRKGGWIAGNVKALTRDLWNRQGRVEFAYQRKGPKGRQMRHAVARIYRLARGYRLIVGRDVEDQRQFTQIIRNAVLSGLAFMVVVGLWGAWLVSRNLLKRIDNVTQTSRIIMAGDLSGRMPVDGSGDELDRLAISLNAMLERMEQLMTGLREVSDNIAHDLKTPLNRMRNRVETALRDEGGMNCREVLQEIIDESDELIRTFNALLSIAKLEAGGNTANFAENNLQEIVRDVSELYEPLAEEKEMQLVTITGQPVMIEVDRQLLGQAIANLIDNAIKYGGSQAKEGEGRGEIVVEAGIFEQDDKENHGPAIFITVADHGRGIPADEVEHAKKRFGRLEKSRSKPGTGLGLSLVAAVAKLHGGQLRLEDNHPGLSCKILIPYNGAHRSPELNTDHS
jgi:signal transduction histidine kinase